MIILEKFSKKLKLETKNQILDTLYVFFSFSFFFDHMSTSDKKHSIFSYAVCYNVGVYRKFTKVIKTICLVTVNPCIPRGLWVSK